MEIAKLIKKYTFREPHTFLLVVHIRCFVNTMKKCLTHLAINIPFRCTAGVLQNSMSICPVEQFNSVLKLKIHHVYLHVDQCARH